MPRPPSPRPSPPRPGRCPGGRRARRAALAGLPEDDATDALVRAGSLTKVVTAATALRLAALARP
ncbi:hypothetical protein [Streptomyces misionensis]|uniref:hypothetical protein n=1 Tax=Streptomyces misionensis TaxID=67331 RepID=UPI000944167F|nr:hypothetical protein [Streptomyces misionensis]